MSPFVSIIKTNKTQTLSPIISKSLDHKKFILCSFDRANSSL